MRRRRSARSRPTPARPMPLIGASNSSGFNTIVLCVLLGVLVLVDMAISFVHAHTVPWTFPGTIDSATGSSTCRPETITPIFFATGWSGKREETRSQSAEPRDPGLPLANPTTPLCRGVTRRNCAVRCFCREIVCSQRPAEWVWALAIAVARLRSGWEELGRSRGNMRLAHESLRSQSGPGRLPGGLARVAVAVAAIVVVCAAVSDS